MWPLNSYWKANQISHLNTSNTAPSHIPNTFMMRGIMTIPLFREASLWVRSFRFFGRCELRGRRPDFGRSRWRPVKGCGTAFLPREATNVRRARRRSEAEDGIAVPFRPTSNDEVYHTVVEMAITESNGRLMVETASNVIEAGDGVDWALCRSSINTDDRRGGGGVSTIDGLGAGQRHMYMHIRSEICWAHVGYMITW